MLEKKYYKIKAFATSTYITLPDTVFSGSDLAVGDLRVFAVVIIHIIS